MPSSVLIVDRVPHPVFNGVTRYMEEIAARAALATDDLEIAVLSWGLRMQPDLWKRLSSTRRALPARLVQLNRQYLYPMAERRCHADLLHFPAHDVPLEWLSTRRKCLFSVHGAAAQAAPQWDTDPNRAARLRSSIAQANADHHSFVTFSQFAKTEIVEHYQIAPERIAVIPHGVDHQQFRVIDAAQVSEFRRIKGLEKPYLLYVGPCAPRKNVMRMIEAFASLKRRGVLTHDFVISGRKHPHQKDVAHLVERAGVSQNVRFLGPLPNEQLPLLYNGASAFAFVSLYEGFGLPVLEAMSCGTPVLTSADSATGEIAKDASVLVSDPKDVDEIAAGMARLLEYSAEKLSEIRDAGMRHAAQFTWEAAAQRHCTLYKRLVDDPSTLQLAMATGASRTEGSG